MHQETLFEDEAMKLDWLPFRAHAYKSWEALHGFRPAWGGAEWRSLKEAVMRLQDVQEAKGRWDAFLRDRADWCNDHNPKVFSARLDKWVPAKPYVDRGPVPESMRQLRERQLALMAQDPTLEPRAARDKAKQEIFSGKSSDIK